MNEMYSKWISSAALIAVIMGGSATIILFWKQDFRWYVVGGVILLLVLMLYIDTLNEHRLARVNYITAKDREQVEKLLMNPALGVHQYHEKRRVEQLASDQEGTFRKSTEGAK